MKKHIAHYLRVSTVEQKLDRQFVDSNNTSLPFAVMNEYVQRYKEKDSGRKPFKEREKGKALLDAVKQGLVKEVQVHSIDRLGRDASDVLSTIKYLTENKVNLRTLKEGLCTLNDDGTENPMSKMMIGILATLADWDWSYRRSAIAEGQAIAKAKGKYKGRKEGTTIDNDRFLKKHRKTLTALQAKNSLRDSAKIGEVSLATAQKVKRIAMQENKL